MSVYYFIRQSRNSKTGSIPVTYTDMESCPSTCLHYRTTCFAGLGKTLLSWKRAGITRFYENGNASGLTISGLVDFIKAIPFGSTFRHNIGGDLPGKGNSLNKKELLEIIKASTSRKLKGFCYTHKKEKAQIAFYKANKTANFTINLSCDSLREVDQLWNTNLPLVVTLPSDATKVTYTPKGNRIVACPAEKGKITCSTCGGPSGPLCTRQNRNFAIGFYAHATRVRELDAKIKAEIIGE